MRCAILGVLFCAATSAVCQSVAPAPLGRLELGQAPPPITQPSMSFGKLGSSEVKTFVPPRIVDSPRMNAARHWDDARIDPEIIAHPSPSRLGLQTAGTQAAQNEYPNLMLLPVGASGSKLRATPAQWPNFKLKALCLASSYLPVALTHHFCY